MVTCTGHIVIHEWADGRTDVRCTDVHDVMAIKPNFLTSMGYHIFLNNLFILNDVSSLLLVINSIYTAVSKLTN